MPPSKPPIELYTDGACSGNPGPGGWAYILKHSDSGKVQEQSGGDPSTTNNRMELMSVIEGLRALDRPCRVDLYCDSQYVCLGLNQWMDEWKANGWKRGRRAVLKNCKLWQDLDELRAIHQITCHWIRGHNEHPENERCDRLAVAESERFKPVA